MTIITMQSLITGLRKSIHEQVTALGSNVFQVQKFPAIHTGGDMFRKYRNRKNITLKEYEAVKETVTAAKSVGAEYWMGGQELRHGEHKTLPIISVCGGTPEFIENIRLMKSVMDVSSLSRMLITIGNMCARCDVARQLFLYDDPLAEKVKITVDIRSDRSFAIARQHFLDIARYLLW